MSAFDSAGYSADVDRSNDVLLAGAMTGGIVFGKSGRLTPNGPYVDLPRTPAVIASGAAGISDGVPSLPEVTVFSNPEPELAGNAAESERPWGLAEFLNPSGQAPYNANWQAEIVRSTLANAIVQQAERNVPGVRALDARDFAHSAQQRALNNYLEKQGSMALGSVAASVSMVTSGNVQTASMVSDLAAPIDSLIAPTGGGGRVAASSARGGRSATSGAASAERSYLDQKFGRTGNLDIDINNRGSMDPRREIDRLVAEGHAVGRHGERVSELALDNRALYKKDPITGTTTDYFTRNSHRVGRNATQFTSNEALLQAETHVRGSSVFANERAQAEANNLNGFPVKGIPLVDALGPNYLDQVSGRSRLGSVNKPTGTASIDFTNGTITSIFRRSQNGSWNLHTMYPEPK